MGFYVGDKTVERIFEGQNSEVGYISTKSNGVFPEDSSLDLDFGYTGGDQHWTAPASGKLTIICKGAGSNNANGGYAKGTIKVTKGQKFSIMVGGRGNRTDNGTTYGFGGSTTYGGRGGGGLSGVFTGEEAIGATQASRVVIIAGGAGGGRTGGGAGGGTTGQNGNSGSYGGPGAGGTQTGRGSGGNTRSEQFRGGGGSGTYGFGGGGGWWGGNGSYGDGSGDDDAQAGGGSGHCCAEMTETTLTVGGGAAANTDGSISFHFESKVVVPIPSYITSAGAYHNPDLGLISISADGENWITISDKNVGATVADPENTDSYGDIFQYGNIYHFDGEGSGGTVTTEAQIPDLTGYEGGNLYSNDKYRTNINWNATNKKLWKPVAFPNLLSLQKGPCDKGFHVPSAEEWTAVLNAILELEGEEAEFSYDLIARYLLMAHPNARKGDGDFYSSNTSIYFTNSYIENQNKINAFVMIGDEGDESGGLSATDMNCGGYIRGFRDVAMIPTTDWIRLGKGSSVRLPLEYQEVEYIQSDGNAYINTNFIPKAKTEFDLVFSPVSYINTYCTIMGTRVTTSSNAYWFGYYAQQDRCYVEFSPQNSDPVSLSWRTLGTKYNVSYHNKVISDGTNSVTLNHTQDSTLPLFIFTGNHNGAAQEPSAIKLFSLKLYEDGSVIHNYIPCYRRIDDVIGLYDLVENKFYSNAGSGTFSRGNEIGIPELPGQYQEVDYIQSSGTQYIDSGLTLETSARLDNFQMRVKATHTGSGNFAGTKSAVDSPTYMTMEVVGSATTTLRCFIANSSTYTDRAVLHDNNVTIDDIRYTYSSSSAVQVINGTSYSQSRSSGYTTSNRPIYIFARNKGDNTTEQLLSMKLYSCLMVVSGKLERFLVPCYRKSDNAVGLFDLINKEFYTNAGTGTFTRGNAINYYRRTQNTISFFPFEANTNDVTGNRTVTFSGPSIQDGSLNIPNSASYGTLNSVVNNSALTISCLYYYGGDATDGKWNTLFAHIGGTYHHILFPAHTDSGTIGNIGFYNSGWNPSSKTLTKNKWYHIVTTKNGTNQKIYVNGVLVQNATSFNNATSGCELGMICNYNSGQKQGPIGKMKEVVFENIEWNLDRIQELYNMYKKDFNLD